MPHPEPEPEEVDALPVVTEGRLRRLTAEREPAPLPARSRPVVQAAAVAAGSFAAGVAAAAVVHHKVSKRPRRLGRRSSTRGLPVVASRSFLVDVHLLDPRS